MGRRWGAAAWLSAGLTANFAVAEGFGPDIKLTRTQTIMQGADHCDFRYRRDAGGGSR